MTEMDPELLELFREEGQERLAHIAQLITKLRQQEAGQDHLEEIDRELHTIKGSVKMVGLGRLGTFVHEVENLTRGIFEADKINHTKVDLLEECCDQISICVEEVLDAEPGSACDQLLQRILAEINGSRRTDLNKPKPEKGKTSRLFQKPLELNPTQPATPPVLETLPEPESSDEVKVVEADTEALPRVSTSRFSRPQIQPSQKSAPKNKAVKKRKTSSTDELVRIRNSKLVTLDSLVSDLIDSRLKIDHHEEELKALIKRVDQGHTVTRAELKSLHQGFREDKQHVSLAVKGLEQLAIDLRLRPLGRVFDQISRTARDLARTFGKKIDIDVQGENTELDRVVLDSLKAPLAHVIRNVVDHGVELPQARLQAGKSERGRISLRAFQDGVSVVIQVEDDGAGVDTEKLKAKVVEKELLTQEQVDKLSFAEVLDLVFIPGLSTRNEASETSGRGVGMDVVRRNVEALKGEAYIESKLGEGTLIGLRVPLTLLISRVLLVRAGSSLIAIPTEALDTTESLDETEIEYYAGQPVWRTRERLVPIASLSQLLDYPNSQSTRQRRLAMVRHKLETLALEIDEFLGERSVVIKPLGWPLTNVPAISGAVILGSGEIALVLQIPELIEIHNQRSAKPSTNRLAKHKLSQIQQSGRVNSGKATIVEPARRRALVVDDSVAFSDLAKSALNSLGFDVNVAKNGQEAWEWLANNSPDLVLTDLEMPVVDGIELVRRIRSDHLLKSLPVIMFSTHKAERKEQALRAGVDEYIVKSEWNDRVLNDAIQRLIKAPGSD